MLCIKIKQQKQQQQQQKNFMVKFPLLETIEKNKSKWKMREKKL